MPVSDIHKEVEKIKGQFLNDASVPESKLSEVSRQNMTDPSTQLHPQSLSSPASGAAASTEAEPLPKSPPGKKSPISNSSKMKSTSSSPPRALPSHSEEVMPLDDIHKEVEAIKQRFLSENKEKDVGAHELSRALDSEEQQGAFLTSFTEPKVSVDGMSKSIDKDHTPVLETSSSSTIAELPNPEIPRGNAMAGVRGNRRTVYVENETTSGAPTIITETVQPAPPVGKWYFLSSPSIFTQSLDATPVIPFDQHLKPKSLPLPPNILIGPGRQEKIILIKRKTTEEVVKGVMQDLESVKIRVPGKDVYDRVVVGRDE